MKRLLLLAGSAALASVGIAVFTTQADSQPQAQGLVTLQPSSPGTAQGGNANLSGTVKAGQFEGGGAALSGTSLNVLRCENDSFSINAAAIYGLSNASSGFTYGGRFDNSSNQGAGVFGWATAGNGTTYGIYGRSSSPSGLGVFGEADSVSGATIGVHGRSSSATGLGMFGYVSSPTGVTRGVLGQSNSKDGFGIYGLNTGSGTGSSYGGFFHSDNGTGLSAEGAYYGAEFKSTSDGGSAVNAIQTATSGYGVAGRFETKGFRGTGVVGASLPQFPTNSDAIGVYGVTTGSNGLGVYGYADYLDGYTKAVFGQYRGGFGWGVFAHGRLGATGTKDFCIDHPLAPLDKYLFHYSAEGPEPMNCYSGSVTTDTKGYAKVALPDYYSEINKEERIQLTVVDLADSDSFVQVKVVGLVNNGGFRIRTSAPRTRVFWRLEAVRNDAWVKRYGAPIEQDKFGIEKGKYQHPELYGAPEEMGMFPHPAQVGDPRNR